MYTITGVTGHVGSATAAALLDRGSAVRVVTRDAARATERHAPWTARGAEAATADLADSGALEAAFAGSDGVFVLLPTDPSAGDDEHRRLADSIATAVERSGVPHVVALSSVGADHAAGTGPIRWLHHLEQRLAGTGAVLTAVRPFHFQEKVETVLDAVTGAGVYPVFADSADVPLPMVATRDIGAAAAAALLDPPAASEVVDVSGPQTTEREVAEHLADLLGRPVEVVTLPRGARVAAMVEAGLPPAFAEELAALYAAEEDGLLVPHGDRLVTGATPLRTTLQEVLGAVSLRR